MSKFCIKHTKKRRWCKGLKKILGVLLCAAMAAADKDVCGRAGDVQDEIRFVVDCDSDCCILCDMFASGELPLRVTLGQHSLYSDYTAPCTYCSSGRNKFVWSKHFIKRKHKQDTCDND